MTTNNNDKLIECILNVMQYGTSYYDDHLYKATGHDNYLEYKFALDELTHEKLVEFNLDIHPGSVDGHGIKSPIQVWEISLTIKGKRLKESGGWIRHKRISFAKVFVNWFIAVGTFVLAGIGVYLQLRPSDKHSDTIDTINKPTQEEKIKIDETPAKLEQSIPLDSVTDSLGQKSKVKK